MATKNQGRTLDDEGKAELAYELALGYYDDEGLRAKFGLQPRALEMYKANEEVRRLVVLKQREIDESDEAMRIHARRAARVSINELALLVQDEDATAKVRMDASRQLREFATIVDKNAIEHPSEGPLYISTNLDLGKGNGVYAITAKDAEEQSADDNPDVIDEDEIDNTDFSDLLGVTSDE